uniref:NIDO domain-containing protein n=1 Tax=Cyprinodon variegatus TaxID=28743 RepID=A0A3Q2CE79_CYPVA
MYLTEKILVTPVLFFRTALPTCSRQDDGSSPRIVLLKTFNYFGISYSQIYVNHNGHLTFDEPWHSYSPEKFPMDEDRDIIAPFWTDLNNILGGNIYYVQYTNGAILQQVTQDINLYFPELNFHANWIFIATWHKVPYFGMPGTQTTFQAVLASNGNYSFVILNYGCLTFTRYPFQVINTIQNSSILSLSSNVNVPGRWVFHVSNGSRGPLYQIGGTTSSRSDDGSSPRISLLQPFNYFGKSYVQIYVNHNGHLTFEAPWRSYSPEPFPMYGSRDIIAPYWTDLDNRQSGNIYYDQYTNGSILQQVTQDINSYFPEINFNATWIFIATWHKVPYYSSPETQSTFQVVLASNGNYSFLLLNYGALAPRETSIEVRALQLYRIFCIFPVFAISIVYFLIYD